jgi:hypothetical protein
MAGLSDLLGAGSVAEQLVVWGVLNQALTAALGPYMTQLSEDVNARVPIVPLAPGDLADAVVRNYLTLQEATAEAAKSGVNAERFATMVPLHADAPGPQQLAAALLRGLITESGAGVDAATFEQGIREGRLNDKWAPLIKGLSQAILSPPDAASAVVRNFLTMAEGTDIARKSGVPDTTFGTLVHLSGDAPGPQQLAEALRRGAIPDAGTGADSISFTQGIAEGRLSDKWAPVIKDLAKLWPTPVDALAAALKGQVTADEGKALYEQLGGDLQFYPWLLNSEGDGPTPLQAADWARRGIIPWDGTGPDNVSYAQAVRESRYRDKWADAYKASVKYLPPPFSIITLLKDGAITKEQATGWLADSGASADVIAGMIAEADATDLSSFRGLTTQAVLNMYYQRLVTVADATAMLQSLHVSDAAIPLMMAYADLQRAIDQQNKAITRIGTLYAARKITEQTAKNSLVTLQVPPAAIDDIMTTWQLENSISVKLLTETQIVDAAALGIMSEDEAITELGNIGYTPYDAWVLLSIKAKAPLPGRPSPGPAPSQGTVIPGTT